MKLELDRSEQKYSCFNSYWDEFSLNNTVLIFPKKVTHIIQRQEIVSQSLKAINMLQSMLTIQPYSIYYIILIIYGACLRIRITFIGFIVFFRWLLKYQHRNILHNCMDKSDMKILSYLNLESWEDKVYYQNSCLPNPVIWSILLLILRRVIDWYYMDYLYKW